MAFGKRTHRKVVRSDWAVGDAIAVAVAWTALMVGITYTYLTLAGY